MMEFFNFDYTPLSAFRSMHLIEQPQEMVFPEDIGSVAEVAGDVEYLLVSDDLFDLGSAERYERLLYPGTGTRAAERQPSGLDRTIGDSIEYGCQEVFRCLSLLKLAGDGRHIFDPACKRVDEGLIGRRERLDKEPAGCGHAAVGLHKNT